MLLASAVPLLLVAVALAMMVAMFPAAAACCCAWLAKRSFVMALGMLPDGFVRSRGEWRALKDGTNRT